MKFRADDMKIIHQNKKFYSKYRKLQQITRKMETVASYLKKKLCCHFHLFVRPYHK